MGMPRYKRVAIDWEQLNSCIISQGYTISTIAEKVGLSEAVFRQAKYDGKMNPAVVFEISKFVKIDVDSIIKDKRIEKLCNGRSTSGRIGIDWLYLERCVNENKLSLGKLSFLLGKSYGYLTACKREGGISEDVLKQIGDILMIDYHTLIKVTSYDRWTLRHEVVDMVNGFNWI